MSRGPVRAQHDDGSRSSGPTRLEEGAFRALLESEEACLDVGGYSFSLITLEGSSAGRTGFDFEELARRASPLLRTTDLIARLGEEKVLMLLPFTGEEQARAIAERILHGQEGPGPQPRCTVEWHGPREQVATAAPKTPALGRDAGGELPRGVRWDARGVPVLLGVELPRWKRVMDVLLASVGLVLLAPLMLAIALVIRVFYGAPVIFKQWRTGRGFRRFEIYKFRTMRQNPNQPWENKGWKGVEHLNEMKGPLFKSSRDPRVHRFGKLLRKTSLDELPQLVNVLKGDMTLIGPRALSPHPTEYETWQLRRFDFTPGIACAWQAEHRRDTDFDDWMRSDLRYVDQGYSVRGDLRLLVSILGAVLRCAGGR